MLKKRTKDVGCLYLKQPYYAMNIIYYDFELFYKHTYCRQFNRPPLTQKSVLVIKYLILCKIRLITSTVSKADIISAHGILFYLNCNSSLHLGSCRLSVLQPALMHHLPSLLTQRSQPGIYFEDIGHNNSKPNITRCTYSSQRI